MQYSTEGWTELAVSMISHGSSTITLLFPKFAHHYHVFLLHKIESSTIQPSTVDCTVMAMKNRYIVTTHLQSVTALSVSTVECQVLARNTVRPVLNRGAE